MPHFLPVRVTSHMASLRRPVLLLVAIGLLLPLGAAVPPAVVAGGSCTGWTSKIVPPDTIRVGRSDGSVDVVDFRTYVGVVMAKEWPGWVPRQAREAGAVAVKQYGWYYALEGHHRSSYVNANGKCYDVKDSTTDQLYKPEKVTVGDKIWTVVDATLGLSVRKDGKFFLTGYRAGSSSQCASDVDGWKLFAKSVIDCAEKGWSREQIQTTYYAPNVTFHWADGETAPAPAAGLDVLISAPVVSLRAGRTLAQKHARIQWDVDEALPSGARYQLQRLAWGKWSTVSLADATHPAVNLRLKPGLAHQFRVRLRDSADNSGPWYTGPRFDARLVQDKSSRFGWSAGDWQRVQKNKASGGTLSYATRPGSQSALTFTGRAVAVVGTMGPDRGRAEIYVNGKLLGDVDLYSPTYRWRVLVFSHSWAKSAERLIRVDIVDSPDRQRVDVDGILFHR